MNKRLSGREMSLMVGGAGTKDVRIRGRDVRMVRYWPRGPGFDSCCLQSLFRRNIFFSVKVHLEKRFERRKNNNYLYNVEQLRAV